MKLKTNKWIRMMSMILSLVLLISCVPNPTHAVSSDEFVHDQNVGGENTGINSQVGVTTEKIPMTIQIVAEDESKRGETYKEYVMNNGLRLATVYPSAIHYEENGVWKDIDNTLIAAVSNGKAVYQNAAGAWNVHFPQSLSGSDMISITKDSHTVQFGMAGELRSTGDLVVASIGEIGRGETAGTLAVSNAQVATAQIQQIDLTAARAAAEHPETVLDKLNSRLSYANVYPNTNVVYDLQSNQLKESVVLQQYDASLWGYRYTLNTGDLVPILREDQQIDLCDPETNEVILTMPAPYMLDNNGETSYDVEVVLTQKGNQYLLSYYLPRAWLAEADRAWPVVLDPVITVQGIYSNVKDITVTENYNEDSGRGVIQCGYYTPAGAMRFYMQFIQLPSIATTNIITNATISLYKPYDSGTTANVEVRKVTQAWESSTISWNNQPAVESNIEDSVVCKLAGRYEWDITNIVNGWYETNNYGMMFKVPSDIETGTTDNWKQFYSADYNLDTATMPLLTIEHAPRGSGGGNSIDEAVVLNLDSSVEVTVAASREKRYFKFTPSTTGFYTFESANNQGDPFACLYNSLGEELITNDDGAGGRNFRLPYHLNANQIYYLALGCYDAGIGDYSVTVFKTVYPTGIATNSISWGASLSVSCNVQQKKVAYKFTPTTTGEYLFYSTCTSGDPQVWLYDSSLTLLKTNDDDAGNRNFRLSVTLTEGHTYYLICGQYNLRTGSYLTYVYKTASINSGTYYLRNVGSSRYIDIHGPYEEVYVHQWIAHTGLQEKWIIQKLADGYYTIRSQFQNRYYMGISTQETDKNNIELFAEISDVTKWKIYEQPSGQIILEPKTAPGKLLYTPNYDIGTELQLSLMGAPVYNTNKWEVLNNVISYVNYYDSSFVGTTLISKISVANRFADLVYSKYYNIGMYMDGAATQYATIIDSCLRDPNAPCTNDMCGDGCAVHHHKNGLVISNQIYNDLRENNHIYVLWTNRDYHTYCNQDEGNHETVGWIAVVYGDRPVIQFMTIAGDANVQLACMALNLVHETAHTLLMDDVYDNEGHDLDYATECVMERFDSSTAYAFYQDIINGVEDPFCSSCEQKMRELTSNISIQGN